MRVQLCVLIMLVCAASLALSAYVGAGAAEVAGQVQFSPEEPCSSEGGICGLESACPIELRHPKKGLCPSQQELGAECCYGVPNNVRECRSRGGECVPIRRCGRAPRDSRGKCATGEVCCIFIF